MTFPRSKHASKAMASGALGHTRPRGEESIHEKLNTESNKEMRSEREDLITLPHLKEASVTLILARHLVRQELHILRRKGKAFRVEAT